MSHPAPTAMTDTLLVTGGCGFIGANFILALLAAAPGGPAIVNLDLLTYAANPATLASVAGHPGYRFVHGDITDADLLASLFAEHRPRAVVHFAAESHVDRSILGPDDFLRTNVDGTFRLLEAARAFHAQLPSAERDRFRFLHVSTDEVYGSLAPADPAFNEGSPFAPRSPYAASKAASDHLVSAWHDTYGLPTLLTHCSNNYGPFQFPEKLIPLVITRALSGEPLPIYGDGLQIRDWLFVGDHVSALQTVLERGVPGETYNIGGDNQRTNLQVVTALCALLDELAPAPEPYGRLLTFVADRPGHDRRYAIDAVKLSRELGWQPAESLETGLRRTVQWYLANAPWLESVTSGAYREWTAANYGSRETLPQGGAR